MSFFSCRLVFRVFRACVFGVQIASFTFCFLFEFCLSHCSIIPSLYTLQIIRTLYIIYIHINIYSFFSFFYPVCVCLSAVSHTVSLVLQFFGYADNRCLLGVVCSSCTHSAPGGSGVGPRVSIQGGAFFFSPQHTQSERTGKQPVTPPHHFHPNSSLG